MECAMGEDDRQPKLNLSEPELVECVFLDGGFVEARDGVIRAVTWCDITETGETRIKRRSAMSLETAERFYRQLGEAIAKARGAGWVKN